MQVEALTSTMDHPGGLLSRNLPTENKCSLDIGGMKVLDHTEMLLVSTMIGTGLITECLVVNCIRDPF